MQPVVKLHTAADCTIDLTMGCYTHGFAGQKADAVAALPELAAPAGTVHASAVTVRRAAKRIEQAPSSLALCLAQQGSFSRTSPRQDAPDTRPEPVPEDTENPLENMQKQGDNTTLEVTPDLVAGLVFKTSVGITQTVAPTSTCASSPEQLGAFLGAPAATPAPAAPSAADPDLAAVLSAWHNLPEPVKAGILAMVKATKQR